MPIQMDLQISRLLMQEFNPEYPVHPCQSLLLTAWFWLCQLGRGFQLPGIKFRGELPDIPMVNGL
jgi:hypothetical protein